MSKVRQLIELYPPLLSRDGVLRREKLFANPQTCPCCNGEGFEWTYDPFGVESVKTTCEACGGSGEVIPSITVDWVPNKLVESKSN